MSYKVRLSDNAEEEIKQLQNPIKHRVKNALRRLAEDPRSGKPLRWQLRRIIQMPSALCKARKR